MCGIETAVLASVSQRQAHSMESGEPDGRRKYFHLPRPTEVSNM
jgi:hypothetical protein